MFFINEIWNFIHMDGVLKAIISEMESEKTVLLSLIDQAVSEKEFLHAHFHSEALEQLNHRLDTLKQLDDNSYYKKKNLSEEIQHLKEMLSKDFSDEKYQQLGKGLIMEKERELSSLNERVEQPDNNPKQIRNLVQDLYNKKIKGLRIRLNGSSYPRIDVKRSRQGLTINIAEVSRLQKEGLLDEEGILRLQGVGFELGQSDRRFTLTIITTDPNCIDDRMTVLSRIIFEAFTVFWGTDSFVEVY